MRWWKAEMIRASRFVVWCRPFIILLTTGLPTTTRSCFPRPVQRLFCRITYAMSLRLILYMNGGSPRIGARSSTRAGHQFRQSSSGCRSPKILDGIRWGSRLATDVMDVGGHETAVLFFALSLDAPIDTWDDPQGDFPTDERYGGYSSPSKDSTPTAHRSPATRPLTKDKSPASQSPGSYGAGSSQKAAASESKAAATGLTFDGWDVREPNAAATRAARLVRFYAEKMHAVAQLDLGITRARDYLCPVRNARICRCSSSI